MTDSMDPKLCVDYLNHLAQAEEVVKDAIRVELKPLMDVVNDRLIDAQQNLETTRKALESPQAAVKVIDGEILKAENEIQARRTLAVSDDMGQRVMANALAQQWENELADLRDKRLEAVSVLAGFEADHAKAENALDKAETDVLFMVVNMGDPFNWYGQSTHAFRVWLESGGAGWVLSTRNESHPAYEPAKRYLEELCHKNEVYPVKRDVDKFYRDMWDDLRDKANAHETTVHNIGDGVENIRLRDEAGYVDDFRGPVVGFDPPEVRQDNWREVPMNREHLKKP